MYSSVSCSFQMGQFQNMIYSICTVRLVFISHSNAGSVKLREIRLTRGIFKTPFVLFPKRTQLQVKPQLAVLWTCLNISHKKIISTETFNIISEYKPTFLRTRNEGLQFWLLKSHFPVFTERSGVKIWSSFTISLGCNRPTEITRFKTDLT